MARKGRGTCDDVPSQPARFQRKLRRTLNSRSIKNGPWRAAAHSELDSACGRPVKRPWEGPIWIDAGPKPNI